MTMSFQDLVLGSAAEVLDIGQATRIWPAAIRRAITLRDKGCAWYSGDRPPAWCDVHHLVPVTGRADR